MMTVWYLIENEKVLYRLAFNSLSGSETDDSELEKNETTKDRVSVSAHNKLEFPFAQLIYMGITLHA